jgi:cytoskeletal protein CcmA (bactofilin family)
MKHLSPSVAAILALLLCAAVLLGVASAQDAGESVLKRGEIPEDLYAAGGTVDIDARVDGDVVAAGGELRVAGSVTGDVMMAGGRLDLRAEVLDDARLAGGRITIDAPIGDYLVVAGGDVEVFPGTRVAGPAWLAGGKLVIAGELDDELKATGGDIKISATVAGDVELMGGHLELLPGARIAGNLRYRSPTEIVIAEGAEVTGDIVYQPIEPTVHEAPGLGIGVLWVIVMTFTALLLLILAPRHTREAVATLRGDLLKSLGLGAAFLVGAPIAVIILLALVIGIPAGLALLALYPVLLLMGYLTTAIALAAQGALWAGREIDGSLTRQALTVLLAFVALALLQAIPLLGALVLLIALLIGTGANLLTWLRKRESALPEAG